MLRTIVAHIAAQSSDHPVRVAIDGRDAAGKSTLADDLAAAAASSGIVVIRASLDDFHRPRRLRYRRGALSPMGYYLDSFDHEAIWAMLLTPLGPGGDRCYHRRSFDLDTDRSSIAPQETAPVNSWLLADGVFLLRPELISGWDVTVHVDVDPGEILRRAVVRDVPRLGSVDRVVSRYWHRYLPAHEHYHDLVDPVHAADIVIDNRDPAFPVITRQAASACGDYSTLASSSTARGLR